VTTFFGLLTAITFVIGMIVGPVAWCCCIYFLFRTANNTVAGRDVWKRPAGVGGWFYNPLNSILDSSQLTPEGLRYRRKLVWSVIWFSAPILLTFLFAWLAGIPVHSG
jgi:hypothetical protein